MKIEHFFSSSFEMLSFTEKKLCVKIIENKNEFYIFNLENN